MKVFAITPNDLRVYDGTTVRVTGLIKGVAQYAKEICLASTAINTELQSVRSLTWLKLRFYGNYTQILHCYSYSAFNESFSKTFGNIFLSKDDFRKISDADVIHAHFLSTLPIALASKRASLDLPLIVDLHGLYCLQPIKFGYEPISYLMVHLLKVYELLKISDNKIFGLVVPSYPLKQIITKRFGLSEERVHVVYDGIDVNAVPEYEDSEVEKTRQDLGVSNRILITYVGTSSFFHGFYDLMYAYKLAKSNEQRLSLLLIVPYRDYTIESLQRMGIKLDDVHIFGSMPRREIYKYLHASDVLILPHRKGTQFDYLSSNKLLDYMASGRPIVAYALPSVLPLLKEYPFKILAEPNKPEKLPSSILEAVSLFKNTHIDGKLYVKEYDWSNIGKMLSNVYTDVLERYSEFNG